MSGRVGVVVIAWKRSFFLYLYILYSLFGIALFSFSFSFLVLLGF